MKVALYARYSSENQRDASIADQIRVCRVFAEREGWLVVDEFSDHAISGATLLRPGFQALMRRALDREFDVVLAESLDRFSRDQEDTAGLFKRLTFLGVRIFTLGEGEITHLHVGFKGTMNALFLKDLADKTRRGLRGRVEAGKSGGGLCYGYRVVRSVAGTTIATGEREIEPNEAAVVERMFREFIGGASPKQIAKRLNHEGIKGPSGSQWNPSTIHGNGQRGTGILNNELYVGRLIWNRLRYVKNPDTGRRVSRLNARSEWITKEVPELRIISNEMWENTKRRQDATRRVLASATSIVRARRPRYLFSGLTKCGVCGSGFVLKSRHRLSCFGAADKGTCSNHLTIRRDEIEARVLHALQEKLLRRDLFEEFCHEFTREVNRLRMAASASVTATERELGRVQAEIGKLVQALKDGVPASIVKDPLIALEAQQTELRARKDRSAQPPPLLHPNMADLYREKVTQLARGLEYEESRTAAAEALRGLIDAIVLTPQEGELKIELQGSRHRRPVSARQAIDRVMLLDGIMTNPELVWLVTEEEKVAFFCVVAPSLATERLPHIALGKRSSTRSRIFPDGLPIGVESNGRVVFLYLVTTSLDGDLSAFVQRHGDLLGALPGWTLRLLFLRQTAGAMASFEAAVRDELAAWSPQTVEELRWYCEQHRTTADPRARCRSDARFGRAHRAFSTPRGQRLYRRWLTDGDTVFDLLSSTAIAEAFARGTARIESQVLLLSYTHLSPLANLVRSSTQGVEKGATPSARPQPPPPAPITVAEELARDWYRLVDARHEAAQQELAAGAAPPTGGVLCRP